MASAPEASRAWLLIEHPGPWPHEPADTPLSAPLRALVSSAVAFGIRVQMIRRPGRRQMSEVRSVFAGWTAGSEAWLRRGEVPVGSADLTGPDPTRADLTGTDLTGLDLERLSTGSEPPFGSPVSEPVFLVCTHARRSACCGRFGAPVARALAARHPGQVWETTHVGGHRFAANRSVLRSGRRRRGDRRDQRVSGRRDHAGTLPRARGPADVGAAGRTRAADANRLPAGRRPRVTPGCGSRPGYDSGSFRWLGHRT